MKKLTAFLSILLINASAFSQDNFPRNEIRVNLFPSFILAYPEITYERIFNGDFSIGASIGAATHSAIIQNFNFTPFGRLYFGERFASGFFIEMNASLFVPGSGLRWGIAGDPYPDEEYPRTHNHRQKLNAGVGVGIGWKAVTRNNWIWDLMIGGGRGTNDTSYPRFGITLGRRF